MAAMHRGRLLLKLADAIEANAEELAQIESLDTGPSAPRQQRASTCRARRSPSATSAAWPTSTRARVVPVEQGFLNYVLREPLGVVGQVVPWNFPLMFTSWKMGPALAAGNTVVLKPAEITPLQLAADRGADGRGRHPAGRRQHPARATAPSPASTSPSTRTSQKICLHRLDRCRPQDRAGLGGQPEARAARARRQGREHRVLGRQHQGRRSTASAFAIFHNQGQACIAGSRLMLHERIADEFLDGFIKLAKSIKLGNPLDPTTEMGPLTSQAAPEARAQLLRDCAAGRRQDPDGRQGARRTGTGEGLLRRADGRDGAAPGPRLPGRSVRTVRRREHVRVRRGSDRRSPTRPNTDSAAACGRPTCSARIASRGTMKAGMVWINCYKRVNPGFAVRRRRAARDTVARWASKPCTTTPMRSRCG